MRRTPDDFLFSVKASVRGPRDDGRRDGRGRGRKLLTQNLEDEQAALRKIQNIGKRLAEDGAKATA